MRYTVDIDGQEVAVELRTSGVGCELSIDGGPFEPARLAACPAPLHSLEVGTRRTAVVIEPDIAHPDALRVALPGHPPVLVTATDARAAIAAAGRSASRARGPQVQRSPMPGVVIEVRVAAGQHVDTGDVLLVLEAMKMQNEIQAERSGRVEELHVSEGEAIPGGGKLVTFVADDEPE